MITHAPLRSGRAELLRRGEVCNHTSARTEQELSPSDGVPASPKMVQDNEFYPSLHRATDGNGDAEKIVSPGSFESGDWSFLSQASRDLVGAAVDFQARAQLVAKIQPPMAAQRDGGTSVCCEEVAVTKERHSLKRAIYSQSPAVQGVPAHTGAKYRQRGED